MAGFSEKCDGEGEKGRTQQRVTFKGQDSASGLAADPGRAGI